MAEQPAEIAAASKSEGPLDAETTTGEPAVSSERPTKAARSGNGKHGHNGNGKLEVVPDAALALHTPARPPTLQRLLDLVRRYSRPTADDLAQIQKAYDFAAKEHAGQTRETGDPYISHPLAVAIILAEMRLVDIETLQAALLHDVLEDCPWITREVMKQEFGEQVTLVVDGVTKLSTLPGRAGMSDPQRREKEKQQEQAEALRKMIMAMFDEFRVVLIKLADRLHNMRTLASSKPEKQKRIAQQTLDIYAPLANRLGIWNIKSELEDLAFYYLDPDQYRELADKLADRREVRDRYLRRVINLLEKALAEAGIKAEIKARSKHIYSISQKMERKKQPFERIYDVLAVRVIVDEVQYCYAALGVVHTLWPPIPSEFDDYIARPKESLYQSLHTGVWAVDRKPLEVQIRTKEMHEMAEFGIAAHWRYKEGGRSGRRDREYENKIASLRRQMDWRHDTVDANEFVASLHSDVFQDHIYVYTPRGDIIEMPTGSTPIDFAYRIHTDLGHQCGGAMVNGRIVPLDTPLNNADMISIVKEKRRIGPNRDWLTPGRNFITTANARQKVQQWFRRLAREENINEGRTILETELRKLGMISKDQGELLALFSRYNTFDDLLEAIGTTDVSPQQISTRLSPPPEAVQPTRIQVPPTPAPQTALDLGGTSNLLCTLARCCRPMPGDTIMGYTTRGRGITIHRADCHNIQNIKGSERERLVAVSWAGIKGERYLARVRAEAVDRVGLMRDVSAVVADEKVNMREVTTLRAENGVDQLIVLGLEVSSTEQLSRVMGRIEGVPGIYEVRREVPRDKSARDA